MSLKKLIWKFIAGAVFKRFLKTSKRAKWSKPYGQPYRRWESDLPWGHGRYYDHRPKYKKSGWKKEAARYIAQTMRRRLGAR